MTVSPNHKLIYVCCDPKTNGINLINEYMDKYPYYSLRTCTFLTPDGNKINTRRHPLPNFCHTLFLKE